MRKFWFYYQLENAGIIDSSNYLFCNLVLQGFEDWGSCNIQPYFQSLMNCLYYSVYRAIEVKSPKGYTEILKINTVWGGIPYYFLRIQLLIWSVGNICKYTSTRILPLAFLLPFTAETVVRYYCSVTSNRRTSMHLLVTMKANYEK